VNTLNTLSEHQTRIEQQMKSKGFDRYQGRQEKQKPSQQEVPHRIIVEALPKVSQAITLALQEDLQRFSSGFGKRSVWYEELENQDPDVLAYIGLNCCFDSVLKTNVLTTALSNIGARVEHEKWAEGLQAHDKELFKRLSTQVTKAHSSERYRFKAMRIIAAKEGYSSLKWSKQKRVAVAAPILSAILEYSGVFNLVEATVNLKTMRSLELTSEATEQLLSMTEREAWATPMFGPMVVPPTPWEDFDTGVYLDDVLSSLVPLVRKSTGEQRRAIDNSLKYGQPKYLQALNALQATPLKVNPTTLAALEWVSAEGKRFGKFPEMEPPELPRLPEDASGLSEEYIQQIRKDQKAWHVKRIEAKANVQVIACDLHDAREMSKFNEFYIGWSLDFRGRMYPVSSFNYHRDDHIKSLFMFARGKKIEESDAGWLSIHLANVGDFNKISKKSLEDRIQWCLDNEPMILSVAEDFKASFDIWSKADKPFQFLAACVEYKKLQDEGIEDYVCHLPISLDGTNSGVQHYAAALRHEDGAMVNLTPSDECQDVYQVVADEVNRLLKLDDSEEAKVWLSVGVGRSTVKRNVMTYGYSSAERGFGDQLIEDLMQPLQKAVSYGELSKHPFGVSGREQESYARFLAKVNYQAVQTVIKSVASGMEFYQAYADALARESKSVRWTSPSGFPVVQRYTKSDTKRVRIFLYDREAKLRKETRVNVASFGSVFDTRKSRNGVSPNAIHSLDAAHMHLSICEGLENGVEDFFMIHDSFGTSIDKTWKFYHCIRDAFVNMYEDQCVFANFEKECRDRLSDPDMELPPVPTKGDLDISAIRDSEYCFS